MKMKSLLLIFQNGQMRSENDKPHAILFPREQFRVMFRKSNDGGERESMRAEECLQTPSLQRKSGRDTHKNDKCSLSLLQQLLRIEAPLADSQGLLTFDFSIFSISGLGSLSFKIKTTKLTHQKKKPLQPQPKGHVEFSSHFPPQTA